MKQECKIKCSKVVNMSQRPCYSQGCRDGLQSGWGLISSFKAVILYLVTQVIDGTWDGIWREDSWAKSASGIIALNKSQWFRASVVIPDLSIVILQVNKLDLNNRQNQTEMKLQTQCSIQVGSGPQTWRDQGESWQLLPILYSRNPTAPGTQSKPTWPSTLHTALYANGTFSYPVMPSVRVSWEINSRFPLFKCP